MFFDIRFKLALFSFLLDVFLVLGDCVLICTRVLLKMVIAALFAQCLYL